VERSDVMSLAAPVSPGREYPPGGWFTATVEPGSRVTVVGDLDINSLDALRSALDQAMLDPGRVLRIDASGLSFVDSTALGELLRYQLIAASQQRRLCIEPLSPAVAKVLDLFDLRHILTSATESAAATQP
jgi:anti-anti-sigma factor